MPNRHRFTQPMINRTLNFPNQHRHFQDTCRSSSARSSHASLPRRIDRHRSTSLTLATTGTLDSSEPPGLDSRARRRLSQRLRGLRLTLDMESFIGTNPRSSSTANEIKLHPLIFLTTASFNRELSNRYRELLVKPISNHPTYRHQTKTSKS